MALLWIYEKSEWEGPADKNGVKTDVLCATINCKMVIAS
jgi:hypothetical protein